MGALDNPSNSPIIFALQIKKLINIMITFKSKLNYQDRLWTYMNLAQGIGILPKEVLQDVSSNLGLWDDENPEIALKDLDQRLSELGATIAAQAFSEGKTVKVYLAGLRVQIRVITKFALNIIEDENTGTNTER
jgi:hypothetical protein